MLSLLIAPGAAPALRGLGQTPAVLLAVSTLSVGVGAGGNWARNWST
jgi:hypothetical protein